MLYVSGFDPTVSKVLLRNTIEVFAPVRSVRMIKDKITGESRGFAFVDFFDHEGAATALANSSRMIVSGNMLECKYAKSSLRNPAPVGPEQTVVAVATPDGFHFDPVSMMYFNPDTSYYYEPSSRIFYNTISEQYFRFDERTREYYEVQSSGEPMPVAEEVEQPPVEPQVASPEPLEPVEQAKPTGLDRTGQSGALKFSMKKRRSIKKPVKVEHAPKEYILKCPQYFDVEHVVCLICERKLSTMKLLKEHESISELHRYCSALPESDRGVRIQRSREVLSTI